VDSLTGSFQWSYTTGGDILSSPAVANGVVYVGSNDNKIYALDAKTGAFLWSYITGAWIESSPAVVDGRVYVDSRDGKLYAFGLDEKAGSGGDHPRPDPAMLVPDNRLRSQMGQEVIVSPQEE
jgi:outer membrane protein assembly factor BamB